MAVRATRYGDSCYKSGRVAPRTHPQNSKRAEANSTSPYCNASSTPLTADKVKLASGHLRLVSSHLRTVSERFSYALSRIGVPWLV